MAKSLSREVCAPPLKGRGTAQNPSNRFEKIHYVPADATDSSSNTKTVILRDTSRTVIATNESPDVGFDFSINPYRGCEHGCIYCYARPTHEYLGYSSGLDFETKILVKENAGDLLRKELSSKNWRPRVVALSGVTDPYQPVEKKLEVTRSVLEALCEFRNPVTIVTKNHLVTRDKDLLCQLAEDKAVSVNLSVTTLRPRLHRLMEPRTSSPHRRLAAITELSRAGIPVGVYVAPVIPGLTDHEIPSIVEAAAAAGATNAIYMLLRLPHSVKDLFRAWLQQNYPWRKDRVLNRIRQMRGGNLNEYRFHMRMKGYGEYARQIKILFEASCKKAGITGEETRLSTEAFRGHPRNQLVLFD